MNRTWTNTGSSQVRPWSKWSLTKPKGTQARTIKLRLRTSKGCVLPCRPVESLSLVTQTLIALIGCVEWWFQTENCSETSCSPKVSSATWKQHRFVRLKCLRKSSKKALRIRLTAKRCSIMSASSPSTSQSPKRKWTSWSRGHSAFAPDTNSLPSSCLNRKTYPCPTNTIQ